MDDLHAPSDRRSFLKLLGLGAATSAVALSGCAPRAGQPDGRTGETAVPTDKMTYRTDRRYMASESSRLRSVMFDILVATR